jgi:hypothetical protein
MQDWWEDLDETEGKTPQPTDVPLGLEQDPGVSDNNEDNVDDGTHLDELRMDTETVGVVDRATVRGKRFADEGNFHDVELKRDRQKICK